MVQLKVTDGCTTRKFSLEPGKDSYQQLKQTLGSFFPECLKEDQEMQLRYRDSDGDLITMTTDSEFQDSLAQLTPQTVWKLHIQSSSPSNTRHATSTSHTHSPSYYSSINRPRQEVRASLQRSPWLPFFMLPYNHTYPRMWDFPSWSDELDDFMNSPSLLHELDDLMHYPSLLHNTARKVSALQKELSSDRKAALQEDNTAEDSPESSKKDAVKQCRNPGESGEVVDSSVPGLKVHKFGSWEPRQYQGAFGSGTVIGPVGYYTTWSQGGDAGDKTDKKEKSEEGEDQKKEAEASSENAA